MLCEKFLDLYNQVFDENGEIKLTSRRVCADLIDAAMAVAPKFDNLYYGDSNPKSPRYGFMNVQRIKDLRIEIP